MSIITQLPLGFLTLSLQVLLTAFLFQGLIAEEVSEGFFATADGLVPGALAAVGGVDGGAGGTDG
jgi:hypothetical protein